MRGGDEDEDGVAGSCVTCFGFIGLCAVQASRKKHNSHSIDPSYLPSLLTSDKETCRLHTNGESGVLTFEAELAELMGDNEQILQTRVGRSLNE